MKRTQLWTRAAMLGGLLATVAVARALVPELIRYVRIKTM